MANLQTCPNCARAMPGGRFNACPACGYDPSKQEPQVSPRPARVILPQSTASTSAARVPRSTTGLLGEFFGANFELKKSLFSLNGRLNRAPFIMLLIFMSVGAIAAAIILIPAIFIDEYMIRYKMQDLPYTTMLIGLFFAAIYLVTIYCGFALTVKRLHDMNMSGAHAIWIYAVYLVPMALINSALAGVSLVLNLVSVAIGIWLMCARGTNGPNRYGSPRVTFHQASPSP